MTMLADRERDRRSLQDLAKMASQGMTPPPPSVTAPHSALRPSAPNSASGAPSSRAVGHAQKDDSGLIDLAMAAQSDPQGAVRAQTTPLASESLFEASGPISSSPLAMPLSQQQIQQPAPSMPPFSAATDSPAGHAFAPEAYAGAASAPYSGAAKDSPRPGAAKNSPRPVTAKKGSGVVVALVFGGLVAAGAIAAGGFFFVRYQRAQADGAIAMNTPAATPIVVAAPPREPVAAAPAPELAVDSKPVAPDPKVAAAPKGAGRANRGTAAIGKEPTPAKEEGPKLSQKDLPTAPAGPEGDLGKAMGAAVGADGKPLQPTPAAGNTGPQFAAGSVPQKPSQGAVTGAIGAVLPGARACLGPDDAVSRASITFLSGGAVQSVNVTGGAAGKPAEGCIKAALGKAKLTPFAEATYTANITVRH